MYEGFESGMYLHILVEESINASDLVITIKLLSVKLWWKLLCRSIQAWKQSLFCQCFSPCVLGPPWSVQTMCWSELWDTPLRLLPWPLPSLSPRSPPLPFTFRLSPWATNRVETGTSLPFTCTHTYSFLLCNGPYRTVARRVLSI